MSHSNHHIQAVVVGTAGHIDHGKTSLIRALTGTDTDRLPDEKKRGLTIDLGFAERSTTQTRFSFVDVPGHERFVRNMVAGSTSVDISLLMVAGDDGVMPQTREHVAILQLLGVRHGVIAISKIDLVDVETLAIVEEEIRHLTRGTFLQDAPLVRVSAVTGEGIDELLSALQAVAATRGAQPTREVFRLPIDRVFTLPGRGTIVTGTLLGGVLLPETEVEILPARSRARVRAVQHHGHPTSEGRPNCRTGVNLTGIKREELARGQELATPGYLRPSKRLLVELRVLPLAKTDMTNGREVRLHLGTAEVSARLVIRDKIPVEAERFVAELRTRAPVVAEYGQHFILRSLSPSATIGGGRILDPSVAPAVRIADLAAEAELRSNSDPAVRLGAVLGEQVTAAMQDLEMACRSGVEPSAIPALLQRLEQSGTIRNLGTPVHPVWLHVRHWQRWLDSAQREIQALMERVHPRRRVPRTVIEDALKPWLSKSGVQCVIDELVRSGWLSPFGDLLGPSDLKVELSRRQQDLLHQAIEIIAAAGLAPPLAKDIAQALDQPLEKIVHLLNYACDEEQLIRVADDMYYAPAALDRARRLCLGAFAESPELTVSALRGIWQVTRKHSFPLCDWISRHGITQRAGDIHTPGPRLLVRIGQPSPAPVTLNSPSPFSETAGPDHPDTANS